MREWMGGEFEGQRRGMSGGLVGGPGTGNGGVCGQAEGGPFLPLGHRQWHHALSR